MELIFRTSGDDDGINQFTMEISSSDTVREIKQKIQELKGFPIFRQTLRFNGGILADNFDFRHFQIGDGSTIYLHIHLRQHIDLNTQPPAEVESSTGANMSVQSGQQTESGGVERASGSIARGRGGKREREDPCSGNRDVRPRVRLYSAPRKLTVVVKHDGQESRVTVVPHEAVWVLRGMLQQNQWRLPLRYDFIHNRRVMDENHSFAYHHVLQGDVIRLSPPSTTPPSHHLPR